MARSLVDILSGLPERKRQAYLKLSDELQRDLAQHIEREGGRIPPLRQLSILLGPECFAYLEPEPHRWMML